MKKAGIIGGLSPESTTTYYQWMNEGVQRRLGGHHSAKLILASVDFGEFVALKDQGDWETQAELLVHEAQSLQRAGADFLLLATNTMHRFADRIEAAIRIPFLHIADATGEAILRERRSVIGLLGTRFTMELDFYRKRLESMGIEVRVPDAAGRDQVNAIIYEELCHGMIREESRRVYRSVMQDLVARGAEGIVLGCTEITLLVNPGDASVPLFDTTRIHVDRAIEELFGPTDS